MQANRATNRSTATPATTYDSTQATVAAATHTEIQIPTGTGSRNGSRFMQPLVLSSDAAQQVAPLVALATRPVALAQPALPATEQPQRVAETPRDSTSVRGWVVQAMAGPALTYRTLGTAPAGSVATLERWALAYSGQLNVGYVFSPRLLLTLGVGYAEYATRLNLQLQTDSTLTSLRSRDTYRFLQLPVQARYWLGRHGAWHYGVVGGAAATVLLGGRTTEGTPCACEQQPIAFSDSTTAYRRVGLRLHVGAQAAYRLNARWSLLVQPTFSYFLTPTAQPSTGLPRRRPWGASLQVGVSLDLP